MALESNDNYEEVMGEINMTPLVDIMLVLLVIFIITLPVVQHAVRVQLPTARSAPDTPQPENLQLTVDAQGQYFLARQAVEAGALEDALRAQATLQPQAQLYIRGDQTVPYARVAFAMAAAQRAGLQKIGFVTQVP